MAFHCCLSEYWNLWEVGFSKSEDHLLQPLTMKQWEEDASTKEDSLWFSDAGFGLGLFLIRDAADSCESICQEGRWGPQKFLLQRREGPNH